MANSSNGGVDPLDGMNHAQLKELARRLSGEVSLLSTEIRFRSQPEIAALTDSMAGWTLGARNGHGPSRGVLKRFFDAFEEARAASTGIEVVRRSDP